MRLALVIGSVAAFVAAAAVTVSDQNPLRTEGTLTASTVLGSASGEPLNGVIGLDDTAVALETVVGEEEGQPVIGPDGVPVTTILPDGSSVPVTWGPRPAGGGPPETGPAATGPGTTSQPRPRPSDRRCVTSPAGEPLPARSGWQRSWLTKPEPNDPLVVTLCVDDVTPATGQKVSVTVIADDPDARIYDGPCDVDVKWADEGDYCRDFFVSNERPERTPPEVHGHQEIVFEHTYRRTGSQRVVARAWSGEDDGAEHPYKSYAAVEIKLSVHSR